jgi:hypothetical protein
MVIHGHAIPPIGKASLDVEKMKADASLKPAKLRRPGSPLAVHGVVQSA